MSRRNTGPKPYASVGDSHVDQAVTRINQYALREAALMTEYHPTVDQTIAMLFPDEKIARAAAAFGLIDAARDIMVYPVPRDITAYPAAPPVAWDNANCMLGLDHTNARSLPIENDHMQINPARVGPLLAVVSEVRAIYEKYEEVKALLRWFNRHATAGAIRAYWPTVLQLCPGCPAFADLMNVPTRYHEPQGISERLQMVRDTATAVASALLLPTTQKARSRSKMWLTFNSHTVQRGDETFVTDGMTFNL